jgi:hypothetical protein
MARKVDIQRGVTTFGRANESQFDRTVSLEAFEIRCAFHRARAAQHEPSIRSTLGDVDRGPYPGSSNLSKESRYTEGESRLSLRRGDGELGTERHNILHTIKMGRDWPVKPTIRA